MKNITLSGAMKIYTGKGMLGNGLILTALILGAYTVLQVCFGLLPDDAAFDIFMPAMSLCVEFSVIGIRGDILVPGGKFVRTVPGGFDTYRKAYIGSFLMSLVCNALLIAALTLIDPLVPLKMHYPYETMLISFAVMLATSALIPLTMMPGVKASLIVPVLVGGIMGFRMGYLSDKGYDMSGDPTVPCIIIIAVSLALIPLTTVIYLRFHRKKRWRP